MSTWVSAVKRKVVTKGIPYFTNLRETGTNTWKCDQMMIHYNSVPEATHISYMSSTITQDDSDKSLSFQLQNQSSRSGWLITGPCSNTDEYVEEDYGSYSIKATCGTSEWSKTINLTHSCYLLELQ